MEQSQNLIIMELILMDIVTEYYLMQRMAMVVGLKVMEA